MSISPTECLLPIGIYPSSPRRWEFREGISATKRISRFLIIFINLLPFTLSFYTPHQPKWNCKILVLLKNPLKCKINSRVETVNSVVCAMNPFFLPFNTKIAPFQFTVLFALSKSLIILFMYFFGLIYILMEFINFIA